MSNSLTIATVQTYLAWENIDANLKHFDKKLSSLSDKIDLVVLPEMFTTGFSMNPTSIAESMDGKSIEWMKNWAAKKNYAIAGSLAIKENEQYFNRFIWIFPNGKLEFYDKRHLFSYAGEHHQYTAGTRQKIINYRDWRFNLNICYDLRFPVWSRLRDNYDALIYVANWPSTRIQAWSILTRARAIENQAYVIAVNRIGKDPNNNLYNGKSAIIDFYGSTLVGNHEDDSILIQQLSKEALNNFRKQFVFQADADEFEVNIY